MLYCTYLALILLFVIGCGSSSEEQKIEPVKRTLLVADTPVFADTITQQGHSLLPITEQKNLLVELAQGFFTGTTKNLSSGQEQLQSLAYELDARIVEIHDDFIEVNSQQP